LKYGAVCVRYFSLHIFLTARFWIIKSELSLEWLQLAQTIAQYCKNGRIRVL